MNDYDAIVLLSFGGPERAEDVMPFLERVVAGRGVPRERLLGVAEHYYALGGRSPINERTQELKEALEAELRSHGIELPLYLGNRFWHPLLDETLEQMKADGIRRAVGIATSAYGSWSGCRAYRRDIARAREAIPGAPEIDKLGPYFDHPGFVATNVDRLRDALTEAGDSEPTVLFTAHSIPRSMAAGCIYEAELREVSRLVADAAGVDRWRLVFQSRSGPPQVPWLEPDVCEAIGAVAAERPGSSVVVAPIGFVADHMEVIWDLDHEAREAAEAAGLRFTRALTANTHPRFVGALRELIQERLGGPSVTRAETRLPPRPGRCGPDCCPPGGRPRGRPSSGRP